VAVLLRRRDNRQMPADRAPLARPRSDEACTPSPQERVRPAGPRTPVASVLALQGSAGNRAVAELLHRGPGRGAPRRLQRAADQHAGTALPSASQLTQIEAQFNPTAAPVAGGPAPAWDGDASQPDHVARRAELQSELTDALTAHLDAAMPGIHAVAAAPAVPVSTYEGAGKAAKRVVDEKFGAYASAAALSDAQRHARDTFAFRAGDRSSGANLLDITDPLVKSPDPADLADWIAQTDRAAQQAQRRHHFNKDRSSDEDTFLVDEVITPFVAARSADLKKYDQFGFAMTDPDAGEVLIVPRVQGSRRFPATTPAGGGPSPAERKSRWDKWQLLVHEYIHTLEHPEFVRARGGNRVLFEGFCEMFTEEVLRTWIPKARADSDRALRADVEGTNSAGALWPRFRPAFVSAYDPGEYADYARAAKEVRTILGRRGGENAVRAAFFQGHVELIGLQPGGGMAAAPTAPADEVLVPAGMTTLADFATMTGLSAAQLRRANPGLSGAAVTPGAALRAPGCRFHVVVAAQDVLTFLGVDIPIAAAERIDQIATQNGVTAADLRRANPAVDFSALTPGDRILIPRH
jgi:hypothetical protein